MDVEHRHGGNRASIAARLGCRPSDLLDASASLVLVTTPKAWSADANDLVRVLRSGRCANCRLADADLVHTDLRDADLNGAELQRANLGVSQLTF